MPRNAGHNERDEPSIQTEHLATSGAVNSPQSASAEQRVVTIDVLSPRQHHGSEIAVVVVVAAGLVVVVAVEIG
jgi:hypothetical protein